MKKEMGVPSINLKKLFTFKSYNMRVQHLHTLGCATGNSCDANHTVGIMDHLAQLVGVVEVCETEH